jgi:glycosyltransferase involved in cell wall biosynthesis
MTCANGVQQAVYALAHAQADLGHTVAVFSREDHGTNILGQHAPLGEFALQGEAEEPRFSSWTLAAYLEPQLARQVLEWKPDIVHFHSMHIPRNVALANFLTHRRIPYCVTVHGALFPRALQRSRLRKLALRALAEQQYVRRAAFIHAVSPHEVPGIRRYGRDTPVAVIPNGVLPSSLESPTSVEYLKNRYSALAGRRVFLFLGRLDIEQKGLDILLPAFARAGLTARAALAVVGEDQRGSKGRLEKLARRLGIESQAVFLDAAYGELRTNVIASADVFVHTSRWEGLSLSVLGAAAAGKCCLVTPCADPFGELARVGGGFIVQPSVSSVSAGLAEAASVPQERLAAMGARAREVVTGRFDWWSVALQIVDAYLHHIPGQRGTV